MRNRTAKSEISLCGGDHTTAATGSRYSPVGARVARYASVMTTKSTAENASATATWGKASLLSGQMAFRM